MEPIIIKLPKDTYLSDIEPFLSNGIDTDSEYDKTVPGCGITTFAIRYFESNLIATLPNKPVIEAKVAKHNEDYPNQKILGVHKGITINHIKAYLLSNVKYKKILTTPEGFIKKVLKAFGDPTVMRSTFFMLIDESERVITDVSYRGDIAAPLHEFFKFERKALVSATTLPFSDARFKGFKKYIIEPDYDYSKALMLINTNNVIEALRAKLSELNSKHVCIFFNSTKGISAVIKALGMGSTSMCFCADDSVLKLIEYGVAEANATDNFHKNKMLQHNFFTSRYFSAIDIELDYKPDIIIISDVYFADHSILDPRTEIIQIAGRFRQGTNTLTHITNFNPNLKARTEADARMYLEGCFDTYDDFVNDYKKATNPGRKETLLKALTESKAHSFYDDGVLNSFMVDNFVYEEKVKGYYQTFDKLKAAYQERSKHFKMTYKDDMYDVEDRDLFDIQGRLPKREKYQRVAEMLYKYKIKSHDHFIFFKPTDIIFKLRKKYPEIAAGVDHLSELALTETGFVLSKIKEAVDEVKEANELLRLAPYVYQVIEANKIHIQTDLIVLMKLAYANAKSTRKVVAEHILKYFHGNRSTQNKKNVYKLREPFLIMKM